MKLLIEAHHPAHVHFWKYPVRELQKRGHEVLMIGRDRDVMRRLLEVYDWIPAEIPPRSSGKNRFPLLEMLQRQWAVAKAIHRFEPDVVASLMGSYTQSAKLFGVRNIIFTDSEHQHFNHSIAHPFADEVHTPDCFYKDLGVKQRRYNGLHELAFLNPIYCKESVSLLGRYTELQETPYVVIRLCAWNTFHDINQGGIGQMLEEFVHELAKRYLVLISAEESNLPHSLKKFASSFLPEEFHSVLSGAAFVLSEGASTASEAACMGVPTVFINSVPPLGYLKMLEARYALLQVYTDSKAGLVAAEEIVSSLDETLFNVWKERSQRLFEESTDVVAHVVETLERQSS